MGAWDWIRIVGGMLLLGEAYRQRQKNLQKKTWLLLLAGGILLILVGAFRV
jgi:hypothetical membrane protein